NAGKRPARVGPETIAIDDYHGLIEMLVVCAEQLDSGRVPTLKDRMEGLIKDYRFVLTERESADKVTLRPRPFPPVAPVSRATRPSAFGSVSARRPSP